MLQNGRHYLAIPGPSVMPDRVLQAMHQPAPNIYAGDLIDMTASLIPDLKYVAQTDRDVAIYICNGHGAWEAAIANTLAPGDRVLVLATGRFALGWAEMARRLGVDTDIVDHGKSSPIDLERVNAALTEAAKGTYNAVLCVQTDTGSSARNDVAGVRDVLRQHDFDGLFMVDCIASFGCDRFEMDAWGVDVMVTACQKGLMTPPGVAFVYMNERAKTVRNTMASVSQYWDWNPRIAPQEYYQYFCGTAPTHHLFGLREALDMIKEETIENVWQRHAVLANAVWAALDAWGKDGPIEMNISDPKDRSYAVTAVRIGAPTGTALRDWVTANAGVTLGIGLGMAEPTDPAWHGFFRIGHMGHVNAQMIMGSLGSIDAGLKALDIAHGHGALEAASRVMASQAV